TRISRVAQTLLGSAVLGAGIFLDHQRKCHGRCDTSVSGITFQTGTYRHLPVVVQYIFLGLCDLSGAGGTTAGLAQEQEDIHSHILSFEDAMAFAAGEGPHRGGANVLPLITALYWLALNRDRLRKGA
ncbi:hypothetical protein JI58_04695, partial [Marinosulfonomonas sp. PRT-SC04]